MSHPNLDGFVTGDGTIVEKPRRAREYRSGGLLTDERAYDAPPPGRTWKPRRNPFLASQLAEIPAWHDRLARVNEPIRQARAALLAEVDALQAVTDDLDDLPAQKKIAQEEADRAVRAALDAGRKPPKVEVIDWAEREASLAAQERSRAERARALHKAYAETVERELPAARAALAAMLEDKRTATLQALQPFAPVAGDYFATLAALDEIAARVNPDDVSWQTTAEAQRVRAAGRGALASLVAALRHDDPVVSGRRHVDPGPHEVPVWTRRAWAEGSAAEISRLVDLEASEGWQGPSNYTERDYAHLFRRPQ